MKLVFSLDKNREVTGTVMIGIYHRIQLFSCSSLAPLKGSSKPDQSGGTNRGFVIGGRTIKITFISTYCSNPNIEVKGIAYPKKDPS
ncbi:hypothetical protein [Alteribacter aurantiacus]|uniref:hypothetical protein n=1 Tax=Alteribacter aurantiacus TaxID=254410 RepID=UPI0004146871|nr:hypothetical protein [Alteribacter aurantiacus]